MLTVKFVDNNALPGAQDWAMVELDGDTVLLFIKREVAFLPTALEQARRAGQRLSRTRRRFYYVA